MDKQKPFHQKMLEKLDIHMKKKELLTYTMYKNLRPQYKNQIYKAFRRKHKGHLGGSVG